MAGIIVRTLICMLGLFLASALLPGVEIEGPGTFILAALLLGLANGFIRPIAIVLTLPLTIVTLGLFILVINSIKSFQVFVEIFVMTNGKFDTSTMVYFIYESGLRTAFRLGYASAAAYLLFVIIAGFSVLQFWLLRRRRTAW